jgi:hypothetical protein
MQFLFVYVPSQQPDGQLQKQHNIQTPVTEHNKRDSNETVTDKTNKNTVKSGIRTPYNNEPITAVPNLTQCDNVPYDDISITNT